MKRIALLISGGGSNMVALARDMTGDHPGRPKLVLSNVPQAGGLLKASAMRIPTAVVDHRDFGSRLAFEETITAELEAARIDAICLAGFMRILTPEFTHRWGGRILNIHPSLLPKYKGLHTHARALEAGDAEHGASVHAVTGELDGGPVLGQARLTVRPDDTPDSLAARVLPLEHRLYPAVLRRWLAGDARPVEIDARD